MNKIIAIAAAAVIALPAVAIAGAHNEAADNDKRSEAASDNLEKVPAGLSMQLERGNTAFVNKPGKRGK